MFPILTLPVGAITAYTAQKLLNNTIYKSYKDLAFVARKYGKNMKIYQDVARPDIFSKLRGLDKREKLGFLQLQALVGMTKFDAVDKNGKAITLETDSHGIIRKTFQKLSELGYLQNYEEEFKKKSHLILPKLAFANSDIGSKTEIYNMKFQRTGKQIDFDDPEFRKMFPMVFSKRGILEKQGYTIVKGEDGELTIDYRKRERAAEKTNLPREQTLKERTKVDISQEEQREFVVNFMKHQDKVAEPKKIEKTK